MQAPRPLISQANLWPPCLVEVLPFAHRVCWSPWWVISLPVGVLAVLLALVRWLGGGRRLSKRQQRVHRLSVALRNVLMVLFGTMGLAMIDTAGETLYGVLVLYRDHDLGLSRLFPPWLLAVVSAVLSSPTVAAQFGRGDERRTAGRLPRFLAFAAAVFLYLSLFVGLNTFAHAVAWKFGTPSDCSLREPTPPAAKSLDVIAEEVGGWRRGEAPSTKPNGDSGPGERIQWYFPLSLAVVLFGFGALGRRRFLNGSSLLPLYTARLARAYLGASNPARIGRSGDAGRVTRPHKNDDIGFSRIPDCVWKHAPLHLINTTINETVDGASDLQHGDRQGVGLAVGPAGLSAGVKHHVVRKHVCESCGARGPTIYPDPCDGFRVFDYPADSGEGHGGEELTLGQWMAISGAAFSTGMGKNTSLGISLLAGFFNVRLGYWWDSGVDPRRRCLSYTPKRFSRVFRKLFLVQSFFADEALARFHGTAHRRLWNLSDGGHFENLGGYELLRRRLPLIVVVDAEADPEYRFAGLSNLVRKARTDFGAEIRFLTSEELEVCEWLPGQGRFGTLEMMRKRAVEGLSTKERAVAEDREVERGGLSDAHAALARVSYSDRDEKSLLVYVKAAVVGDEPVDVLGYKSLHQAFPQETTADQFFDEAQWESYRKLGEFVGERVFEKGLDAFLGADTGRSTNRK